MSTQELPINKVVASVGWILLLSALAFYCYGIYKAISQTVSAKPVDYPEFLSTTIASIQALLLTNLGILLGISVTAPNSSVAHTLRLNNSSPAEGVPAPLELKDKVQLLGLLIYLASLISCVVTWAIIGFKTKSDMIVAIVPESAKMFVGVALAYLTLVLRK